jgi:CheY-like chemotaxis protein
VSDTGIGISEKDISKLFKPFSQIDGSSTKKYEGTGLGLAICKKVVELMSGELSVSSQIGIGSNFRFTLPFGLISEDQISTCRQNFENVKISFTCENYFLKKRIVHLMEARGIKYVLRSEMDVVNSNQKDLTEDIYIVDMGETQEDIVLKSELIKRLEKKKRIFLLSLKQDLEVNAASSILRKPIKQSDLYELLEKSLEDKPNSTMIPKVLVKSIKDLRQIKNQSYAKYKILIAEDHLINQKVIGQILQNLGCRFDIVADGKEAIEAVQNFKYDLIFMDCQMPEIDGYSATTTIRSFEKSRIPIIALTANAVLGEKEKCISVGMDDYLSKPIEVADIEKTLEKWLCDEKIDKLQISSYMPEQDLDGELDILTIEKLKTLGEGSSFVEELVAIFIDTTPQLIESLTIAVRDQRPEPVKSLSHRLKGASKNLGARKLALLCSELEKKALECDLRDAPLIAKRIADQYEQAKEALISHLRV